MSRLAPIADIPEDMDERVKSILKAIKQNVEVLAGFSGSDRVDQAIRHSVVRVADVDPMQAVYSVGAPTKAEFDPVIDDLTRIRDRVNYLIALLRGEQVGG